MQRLPPQSGQRRDASVILATTFSITLLALPARWYADRLSLRWPLDVALYAVLDSYLRRRRAPGSGRIRMRDSVSQLEDHLGGAGDLLAGWGSRGVNCW